MEQLAESSRVARQRRPRAIDAGYQGDGLKDDLITLEDVADLFRWTGKHRRRLAARWVRNNGLRKFRPQQRRILVSKADVLRVAQRGGV